MDLMELAGDIASDTFESVEYKYDNDRVYDYIALELARESSVISSHLRAGTC